MRERLIQIACVILLIAGVNLVVLDGVIGYVGAAMLGAFVMVVREK